MRRGAVIAAAVVGLVVGGVGFGPPAQAAPPKKFTATIAVGAMALPNFVAGGDTTDAVRRTCPGAGEADGVFYKFFDLGSGYTKLKAYGPTPVVSHPLPGNPAYKGSVMDYEFDLFIFDAKCRQIDTPGGGDFGGLEQTTAPARNPARYAVISYWYGPPNIQVTLEAS